MKAKILSLCALLSFGIPSTAQQRQKTTVDYSIVQELELFGKMTYHYVIDDDGKSVHDGPLSISAKRTVNNFRPNPFVSPISFNGTYTLQGACKKGYIDGPLTLRSRQTISQSGKTGNYQQSYTGHFTQGVPNGSFNINVKRLMGYKMTAQFKKGELVGPYMFDGFARDSRDNDVPTTIKGTLSSTGQPTGTWTYKVYNTQNKYVFQNGILISRYNQEGGTRPAIVELSKRYAAGTITEEELFKQNLVVATGYLNLDEATHTALHDHNVIEFDRIAQHYDFSASHKKSYKVLRPLPIVTAEGYHHIKSDIIKMARTLDAHFVKSLGETAYWNCVEYDSTYRHYYFESYQKLYAKKYTTCDQGNDERVYLTDAQMDDLKHSLDSIFISTAVTTSQLLDMENYGPKNMSLDSLSFDQLKIYLTHLKSQKNKFDQYLRPVRGNDKYVYYVYEDSGYNKHTLYLEKASLQDLDMAITKTQELMAKKEKEKQQLAAERKVQKAAEQQAALQKAAEEQQIQEAKVKKERRKKKARNFFKSLLE